MSICEDAAYLLKDFRLTQMQLAEEIGVSQGSVSRWKNGIVPDPAQQDMIDGYERKKRGVTDASAFQNRVRVDGRVGAGAVIEPDAEQVPADDSPQNPRPKLSAKCHGNVRHVRSPE